jgi:hypothetical protein
VSDRRAGAPDRRGRRRAAAWLVLTAAGALSACETPNLRGVRTAWDGAVIGDSGGRSDAAVDAPVDRAPPPADAAPAPPDTRIEPPGRPPDAAAPTGVPPDAAPDTRPLPPPDASTAPECTPGVRGCIDTGASRVCSPQGRWLPAERCAGGTTCSGGACVCPAGACEDGVLRAQPGYIGQIAAGGGRLHYTHFQTGATDFVETVDLGNATTLAVQRPPVGDTVNPGLAADAMGALYWCRRREMATPGMEGELMRGSEVLAPGVCDRLLASGPHLLFSLEATPGLFRRPLRAAATVAAELITDRGLLSFAATDRYLFVATRDQDLQRSRIERMEVADPSRVQMIAERVGFFEQIFDAMAVDEAHVYVSFADQILRTGTGGGEAFQTFVSAEGPEIEHIALSDTHVYWTVLVPGINACSEASVWRRSKLRDDQPVRLARRERTCPNGLTLAGDRVYAAVVGLPGPSQILRLRR